MDIITFQCANCQKVMRIGADKAGKKARCSQCGESLVIPRQSQPINSGGPAKSATASIFGDDEAGVYKFLDEPESAEKGKEKVSFQDLYDTDDDDDEDGKKKKKKGKNEEEEEKKEREAARLLAARRKDAMARMRKAPIDFSVWEKIRLGVLLVIVGIFFLLGSVALQKIVFLIGLGYTSEYAYVAATELMNRSEPPEPGNVPTLYKSRFIVGLLGGSEMIELNLWLYRLSYLFILIQLICTGTGYVYCLNAPTRFAARGLAIALLPMVCYSFVITLTLKLLPMAGAYTYTMIPLISPEVGILRANIEREVPIHLFWSAAPFWETFLSILLHLATFGELVIFCLFLRSLALNLKDERLEKTTDPLIRLGLSIAFTLMAFLLLINTGTTEVLVNVLWIVYLAVFGFYLWFLIWYLMALFLARERIAKAIQIYGGGETSEDEDDLDDVDEDEEEEYEEYEEDEDED